MNLQDLLSETDRHLKYTGGCANCPRALKDFVPATLRNTKLVIVGEAPGATEVETQEGFTGKSGQVLRKALKDVGITEFSLTNAIHCRPPENRDPTDKEISCCMNQHVMSEVGHYSIAVLAGSQPTGAFFPGHVQQVRGHLAYHPDFPNTRFFSMLHPASIGYDPKRKDEFYQQVDRLARILRGEPPKFVMVTGATFRERFATFLQATTILSLDIETSRLESWNPGEGIRSLSACSHGSNEIYSIDDSDPFFPHAIRLVGEYLQNPEKQVVGQNIGYDLVWFERELQMKCNLRYIHDLQTLYYQLESRKQLSLKPLVAEKLDGYRHLVVWPHLEKNLDHLKLYNGEDVFYPLQLFLQDFPRLRPQQRDLSLRVLGPSSLATRRITHAGIYFRSENWIHLDKEYAERRQKEIDALVAADPLFDPRKYVTEKGFKDLDKYIYEVRKAPVLKVTSKEEKPSTDESAIKEHIRAGYKEWEHILNIKGIDKRRSTYILPFPKLVSKYDRRIHANYNNTATSTGRLSSSNPNMQNNPRNDDNYQNQVRWCFGAGPGNVFLDGDFSQIELRLAMSFANDPVGIQAYIDGKDIHKETAAGIIGEGKEPTKLDRFKAKSANFALIYGGTAFTLQSYALDNYGVAMTDDDAKKWVAGFFGKYKSLPDWHRAEIQKLRENKGHMESAVGHVWYFPEWDAPIPEVRSHTERSAINLTCQGPAAYMMTYLIYLTQQAFWQNGIKAEGLGNAEVVLTVHDSLGAEIRQDMAEAGLAVVRQSLAHVEQWAQTWGFKVPLVLDTKLCDVWDKE